jgi:hypothetical protein
MAFKLRILFDGLCILVPNTEESKGMRVLVIDARAPGVATNGENQVSHIPSVRFNLADLAPGRRQPSYRVEFAAEESVPRGQWYLNGDDLEIRVDGRGLPDEPLTVLRSHPTRDFSLIPTMKTIYPDFGGVDVRDECLDDNLKRLTDAGLVGRLRLKAGVVGAWDGHDGRFISSDEYMFTGDPARHRQRIASRTFFETEIAGEEVEVFSRQRGHGLVLRPENGDLVELSFENQPPSDLMSAKPADPNFDYDFELVYLIAKNPPLPLRIPVLATAAWAAETAPSSLGGLTNSEANVGSPKCPPATYNQSSEALVQSPKCPPAAFNSSSEAGVSNPKCPPVAYNPTGEAHMGNPSCPPVVYNPNSEAAISNPKCPPVTYNPTCEAAAIERPICPGTIYNPSSEAGVNSRPICAPTTYNPSAEASPDSRPICPMGVYNPHPKA